MKLSTLLNIIVSENVFHRDYLLLVSLISQSLKSPYNVSCISIVNRDIEAI